jgi:hypothetical protein
MNIEVYSVDTNQCDKRRPDGVQIFSKNELFYDPKRQANMYMALSHEFVQTDISIYLAGNMILFNPNNIKQMVNELLGNNDIAIYHHHKRNCIYKEFLSISNKDDPEVMKIQMDKYLERGYPENNGLVETGMIIRRHNEMVIAFNNAWFAELCLHSKRSQLSFNYTISLFPKLKVNILPGNIRHNKYIYQRKHNRIYLKNSFFKQTQEEEDEEMTEGIRTIVMIRSRYEKKISSLRLQLFQQYCIDSLKKQTDKNFEVHILIKHETADQVKQLDWGKLKVQFKEEIPGIGWNSYAAVLRKEYMNEPNLQIRMDNDDWIADSFIKKIKGLIKDQKNLLITFHPTKYLHNENGKQYFSQKKYNAKSPSMFFGIYQEIPIHWILDRQHGQMGRLFENGMYVKTFGLCNLVIHDENQLNKI